MKIKIVKEKGYFNDNYYYYVVKRKFLCFWIDFDFGLARTDNVFTDLDNAIESIKKHLRKNKKVLNKEEIVYTGIIKNGSLWSE